MRSYRGFVKILKTVYVSAGSFRGAAYDFFGDAFIKLAQPFELLKDICCHPFAYPVDGLPECEACVVVDEK